MNREEYKAKIESLTRRYCSAAAKGSDRADGYYKQIASLIERLKAEEFGEDLMIELDIVE